MSGTASTKGKLVPWGGVPIMRAALGAECMVSWCPAQCQSNASLGKGGRQGTTEMPLLREAMAGVVLGPLAARWPRRGDGVGTPEAAVGWRGSRSTRCQVGAQRPWGRLSTGRRGLRRCGAPVCRPCAQASAGNDLHMSPKALTWSSVPRRGRSSGHDNGACGGLGKISQWA